MMHPFEEQDNFWTKRIYCDIEIYKKTKTIMCKVQEMNVRCEQKITVVNFPNFKFNRKVRRTKGQ
jgi:hypothetical protein